MYLSPQITCGVVSSYKRMLENDGDSPFSVLSEREREVVQLLADGNSTGRIATLLNISPKTVASHRKRIMDALGITSIVELTKLAIRENLVSLDI
jgi:DNA-binding NarL/FixJ family response regulator